MSDSSVGKLFKISTFGESHGPAMGCVVDGCPPGLALSEQDIQPDLDRRKPGQSAFTTQRKESDQIQILSGVFEGKTTGASIGLLVKNQDQKSKDYRDIAQLFRPGHADYTYQQKYGIRDYRGGGRSSARSTVMSVAAGAIAKKYLQQKVGIIITGYLQAMGHIACDTVDLSQIQQNPFNCPQADKVPLMAEYIKQLRREGDSIGAKITVMATHMPVGLGAPVFNTLDADIAKVMMGLNAVKGVEIGAGFSCVEQKGSEHRDELYPDGFASNHAGGVLGGISSGQNIHVNIAIKPTSSITTPGHTINTKAQAETVVTKGRHDPCVGIRAVPIAEALLAMVLMDHYLQDRAQNADVDSTTPVIAYSKIPK